MARRPTDEEAWALEKMWTENPPEVLEGTGPLTRRRELLRFLDDTSTNYILTIAEHDHKTPAQVVGDMVRERIAAAAQAPGTVFSD
ncbi:hypothetical protein AGMMS49928_28660 [Spirochaetia bacterium]|nr:hypothetical protein AGMMS49928_28660 [Spirochaetia bacterium]